MADDVITCGDCGKMFNPYEYVGHGCFPPERNATVSEVIDGRRGVYGDPAEMFARAAQIWSGIIGYPINACDVPLMLIGYKVLRAQHTPDYSDNSDDIEGYLDIFRELLGEDMIHARSVSEYLEKKGQR